MTSKKGGGGEALAGGLDASLGLCVLRWEEVGGGGGCGNGGGGGGDGDGGGGGGGLGGGGCFTKIGRPPGSSGRTSVACSCCNNSSLLRSMVFQSSSRIPFVSSEFGFKQ